MRRALIVFTSDQGFFCPNSTRYMSSKERYYISNIGVSIDTDRKMRIPLQVYFQLYVICYGELVITLFKEIVNFCIALFIFMSNMSSFSVLGSLIVHKGF